MWTTLVFLVLCATDTLTQAILIADDVPCTRLFIGHDCIIPLDTAVPVASDASICVLLELPNIPASGTTATKTFTQTDLTAGGIRNIQPCLALRTTEVTEPKLATATEAGDMPLALSATNDTEPMTVTAGATSDMVQATSSAIITLGATRNSGAGIGIIPLNASSSSTPYRTTLVATTAEPYTWTGTFMGRPTVYTATTLGYVVEINEPDKPATSTFVPFKQHELPRGPIPREQWIAILLPPIFCVLTFFFTMLIGLVIVPYHWWRPWRRQLLHYPQQA